MMGFVCVFQAIIPIGLLWPTLTYTGNAVRRDIIQMVFRINIPTPRIEVQFSLPYLISLVKFRNYLRRAMSQIQFYVAKCKTVYHNPVSLRLDQLKKIKSKVKLTIPWVIQILQHRFQEPAVQRKDMNPCNCKETCHKLQNMLDSHRVDVLIANYSSPKGDNIFYWET